MSYQLIRESWPVARKVHRCIWCGESIKVGEKHRYEVSRYDGLQFNRWHAECEEDAQEYFRDGEDEFIPYSNERPKQFQVKS